MLCVGSTALCHAQEIVPAMRAQVTRGSTCEFSLPQNHYIVHCPISDFVKCKVIVGERAGLVPSPLLCPEGKVQFLAGLSLSLILSLSFHLSRMFTRTLRKRVYYPH